jgi:hypothetical protein
VSVRSRHRGVSLKFLGAVVFPLLLVASVRAQAPFLDRKPVRSSDLASVAYNERRRLLEIEFRSGGIYRYIDVPKEIFDALLASESKGRFFAARIRNQFRHELVKPRTSAAK